MHFKIASELLEHPLYIYIYMSCRSYTCCRSYNFDKIFAEVTTSTDDVVEVVTSTIILAEVITSSMCFVEV